MKRLVLLLYIFIQSLPALACVQYELSGFVERKGSDLEVVVAKHTKSEKHLKIPYKIQLKFSPYLDKFMKGVFITEGNRLTDQQKILKVERIDLEVFDPLNQNESNSFLKLKEVKCPAL